MKKFLSIREAARAGIAPETLIRRLVAQNRCPGIYSGKRFYVNVDLLEQFLESESRVYMHTDKNTN